MAYNEYLQERIEFILKERNIRFEAKKMMGGLCFMIDEKMCLGIVNDELMARVGEEKYDELLLKKGARAMDFTKRPMKGFLFVSADGIDFQDDLEYWVDRCLEYNPFAKSSKKKK